jgi:molybdate transport system substrate-binding protein
MVAAAPAFADAASLRQAIDAAEALVFNRASTGLYLDRLFENWGITATVAAKSVRFPTGAEVLARVLSGTGAELGFAAITEIHMVPALRYLGPLPAEVQNTTTYAVALLPNAVAEAPDLLRHLGSPAARALLDAAGVEAAA